MRNCSRWGKLGQFFGYPQKIVPTWSLTPLTKDWSIMVPRVQNFIFTSRKFPCCFKTCTKPLGLSLLSFWNAFSCLQSWKYFNSLNTLFHMEYWFPLCYRGGGNSPSPPQLKHTLLSVRFQVCHTCIEMYVKLAKIIKKKDKKNCENGREIKIQEISKITKMSTIRSNINILSSSSLQTSLFWEY